MSAGEPIERATLRDVPVGQSKTTVIALIALVGLLAILGCGLVAYVVHRQLGDASGSGLSTHPTGTVLLSIRELAKLETNELHLEKVVDLTDSQNRLFGLLPASDAILLVAAGDVTLGIDLAKLRDSDVSVDRATGEARLVLPAPEILSSRLDEAHTYVYQRTTSVLARRNEQLESRARQEALRAITDAARDGDAMEQARRQAEKQLQFLMQRFGVAHTTIGWRPS
jgi:hypothetical protein